MNWHTTDEEPLETGVILFSVKRNRFYDATYIGDWRVDVNGLTVMLIQFDYWIQRGDFFVESGLRDKIEEVYD